MPEEQLKAFWEAVQSDTSLQEKLRATSDANSIASIAKEAGFKITADEVKEAQSFAEEELSAEELQAVAGGKHSTLGTYCIMEQPEISKSNMKTNMKKFFNRFKKPF